MGELDRPRNMRLISWTLLPPFFCQRISWGGSCPEVPLIADFSVENYLGSWYEQFRYPNNFQYTDGKCTTAKYSRMDDPTVVEVNNTQINMDDNGLWRASFSIGEAKQVYPEDFPNKLKVSFPMDNAFLSWIVDLFSGKTNYHIMETDYDNYSLVMGCQKFWFIRVEYAWILSRTRDFRSNDPLFDTVLERAQTRYGLETTNAIYDIQQDCQYDYREYYDRNN